VGERPEAKILPLRRSECDSKQMSPQSQHANPIGQRIRWMLCAVAVHIPSTRLGRPSGNTAVPLGKRSPCLAWYLAKSSPPSPSHEQSWEARPVQQPWSLRPQVRLHCISCRVSRVRSLHNLPICPRSSPEKQIGRQRLEKL
jgi:hypothetical protein